MPYKTVIFDLDGTLIHTSFEYVRNTVGNALRELGSSSPDEHIHRFWFYSGRDKTIRQYFGVKPDDFWPVLRRYDTPEARMKVAMPYEDVDIIPELKRSGFKLGIVTGAPANIIPVEVEMLGSESFDAVVRAQESSGVKPKPDPHGIYECMKLLEARKDETVFVGNGIEDMMAAQAAGVLDVHIDRGEHATDGTSPSVRINSLYEMRKILRIEMP